MIITLIALGIFTIGLIGYCVFKYLDTKLDKARDAYWDAEHKVDNVRYQIMMMADSNEKKKEKEAELSALKTQRDKCAKVKKRYDHDYSWPGSIFSFICILGLAASLVCGLIILGNHLPGSVETTFTELQMERD